MKYLVIQIKQRRLLFILIFFIPFSCLNKKTEQPQNKEQTDNTTDSLTPIDSISIEHIYADNPFAFDTLSINKFINYINIPTEQITEAVQNMHDSESIDSLITLKWGDSKVLFYKSSYNNLEFIDFADIYDSNFTFKNGLKTGMSLEEVKSKFDIFKNDTKNYKYIEFYYGDATNYTVLFFNNGKLKSVRYMPYTG